MEARTHQSARRHLEKVLLQKLLALTLEQRDCLIAGAAARLGEIVGEQAALLQRLSRNADRIAVPAQSGEPAREIPDSALAGEIRELAQRVQMEARLNRRLAQEAAKYVDFTLNAICGRESEASYSPGGRRDSRSSPIFMSKTA
jgi:hypothetical protein